MSRSDDDHGPFDVAFISSKVVVGEMPHEVAAALRFAGGAVILGLMLSFRPRKGVIRWRQMCRAGVVGLVGVFAYNFFFFWGVSLAPAVDGSVIVPVLSPVLTTAALLVTRKEKASIFADSARPVRSPPRSRCSPCRSSG